VSLLVNLIKKSELLLADKEAKSFNFTLNPAFRQAHVSRSFL